MSNIICKINIQGVDVYVGRGLKGSRTFGLVALGGIPVKLVKKDDHGHLTVEYDRMSVLVNKKQLAVICSMAGFRNEWEREMRCMLALNEEFKKDIVERHGNVSDIFPVRLNVVRQLDEMGWKNNQLDISREMRRVYGDWS